MRRCEGEQNGRAGVKERTNVDEVYGRTEWKM